MWPSNFSKSSKTSCPLNGVIIKQEIDYDGALTMRTTVRQPDWMINLGGEG